MQADRAKTKSSLRTLPLVPPIRDRLLMLKGQQDTYRRLCGKSYNREYLGYLCVDEIGNIIRPKDRVDGRCFGKKEWTDE